MIILRPLPILSVTTSAGTGSANLLSPQPKEIWRGDVPGGHDILVDLGGDQAVDCFFLGFTNAEAGTTWQINRLASPGGASTNLSPYLAVRAADSLGPRHHAFIQLAAPVNGRFFQIRTYHPGPSPMQVGALAIGKAFVAPYEYDSGRQAIDTGTREDLADGGFGMGAGVVKSGLRWTFPDLSPADRRALWAIVKDRGIRKPVVVVEQTGEDAGLAEEVHYGCFDRFEPYARRAPSSTRWALSMTSWV